MSLLEKQLTQRSVHDTMATTFFNMAGQNLIIYVRFSIRNRKQIHSFVKNLDEDKRKRMDLFFICEELNITDSDSKPVFFAIFTYFLGAQEQTKKLFESIITCKVLEVTSFQINELFEKMCEINFIQINMFDRLGRVNGKIFKRTSNPFAQVYFYQDVSLFNNLDEAIQFISTKLPQLLEQPRQRKPCSAYQRKISNILFGTFTRDYIHVCKKDLAILQKMRELLKKYETQREANDMKDESQEFENVDYKEFEQSFEAQSEEEWKVLKFLKKIRQSSIMQIRDRLREAQRKMIRQQ